MNKLEEFKNNRRNTLEIKEAEFVAREEKNNKDKLEAAKRLVNLVLGDLTTEITKIEAIGAESAKVFFAGHWPIIICPFETSSNSTTYFFKVYKWGDRSFISRLPRWAKGFDNFGDALLYAEKSKFAKFVTRG